MIVTGTQLIASLWVPNRKSELAYEVYRRDPDWVAPEIWKAEFRSLLCEMFLDEKYWFHRILRMVEHAELFMKNYEYETPYTSLLFQAHYSMCSAYELEFACLAEHLQVPLVTYNKNLLKQHRDIAIHPKEFAEDSAGGYSDAAEGDAAEGDAAEGDAAEGGAAEGGAADGGAATEGEAAEGKAEGDAADGGAATEGEAAEGKAEGGAATGGGGESNPSEDSAGEGTGHGWEDFEDGSPDSLRE